MVNAILRNLFKRCTGDGAKCMTLSRTSSYENEVRKLSKKLTPLDYDYLMGRGRFYSALFSANNQ